MRFAFAFLVFLFASCSDGNNSKNTKSNAETESLTEAFYAPTPDLKVRFCEKTKEIEDVFYNLYYKRGFNGCVLVAKEGEVLYKKAWGYFNREKKIDLQENSIFQLASVTKQFTAIAILRLMKEGKLSLEQNVKEWIPDFPYEGINLKLLLCHRSGLPDYRYFCDVEYKEKSTALSNENAIKLMNTCKPPLYYKPNKHFDYNNTNYMLLANIIEKASGMSYKEYLNKIIFKPLRMEHTFVYDKLDTPKNVAIGYSAGCRRLYNDYQNGVVGDKNIYSNVEDLYKWDQALYNGTVLDSATLALAYQPYSPEMKTRNYGYGFRLKKLPNNDFIVFHGGWWKGYNTLFYRRLKDKTTIIILSNRANFCFNDMTKVWNILDNENNKTVPSQQQDI